MPKQDWRLHTPNRRGLQEVAKGGVPGRVDVHPPKSRYIEEAGGPDAKKLSAWGDTEKYGLENSHPGTKGKHQHPKDWLARSPLEGDEGYRQNLPKGVHNLPLQSSWITHGKKNGDSHPINQTQPGAG